MASSSSKTAENRRVFTCSHDGCEAQIISASPKTKFCKKHRQNIYKHKYIERGHKLRQKYQESRACFRGSSNPFDGQDLDDMLQQILQQKRLELMRSPQVIQFLKSHQNDLEIKTKRRVIQISRHHQADSASNSNNSLSYSSCPLDQDQMKGFQSIDQSLISNVSEQETINKTSELLLESFSGCGNSDSIIQTDEKDTDPQIDRNSVTSNLNEEPSKLKMTTAITGTPISGVSSSDHWFLPLQFSNQSRRSAFQETGAGDAQSLFAVRSYTHTD